MHAFLGVCIVTSTASKAARAIRRYLRETSKKQNGAADREIRSTDAELELLRS